MCTLHSTVRSSTEEPNDAQHASETRKSIQRLAERELRKSANALSDVNENDPGQGPRDARLDQVAAVEQPQTAPCQKTSAWKRERVGKRLQEWVSLTSHHWTTKPCARYSRSGTSNRDAATSRSSQRRSEPRKAWSSRATPTPACSRAKGPQRCCGAKFQTEAPPEPSYAPKDGPVYANSSTSSFVPSRAVSWTDKSVW